MTNTPETLLVLRDGYIDDEYYNVIYSQKRKQALLQSAREVLQLPLIVGSNILSVLREHDFTA